MKTNTIEELAKLHPDLIKKVKTMKVQTWLPVFSGFYGTIFDTDNLDDMIEQDIKDYCQENKLSIEQELVLLDNVFISNAYYEAYKEYQNNVCSSCVNTIEKELKDLNVVKSVKMEKLVSPREYNFSNDSIDIEVIFSKKNIIEIKKIIKNNIGTWETYLKERYTSYDGFMSSHDNYVDSEEWQIEQAMQKEHNAGAVLNFICLLNDIDEIMLYENIDDNYLFVDIDGLYNELKKENKI